MCGPVYLTQMKRKAVTFYFCSWCWLLVVMAADGHHNSDPNFGPHSWTPFWTPFLDPSFGPQF